MHAGCQRHGLCPPLRFSPWPSLELVQVDSRVHRLAPQGCFAVLPIHTCGRLGMSILWRGARRGKPLGCQAGGLAAPQFDPALRCSADLTKQAFVCAGELLAADDVPRGPFEQICGVPTSVCDACCVMAREAREGWVLQRCCREALG